jgi:type IV pilus assembly protein PilV
MNNLNRHQQQGSVLIEALIAVLIFSMGILALVGLQGAMIKNSANAKYRAEASLIAQERLGTMMTDPLNVANFVEADTVLTSLPNGKRTTVIGARRLATVTVSWKAPGTDEHKYETSAYINAIY